MIHLSKRTIYIVAAILLFLSIYPVHPSYGETMLNVKDYGALGDGITDDTASIQNALNFASQQGIPLLFPQGTYNVKQLFVPSNSSVVGQGAIIKAAADSYSLFVVKGDHVSISGLTLEGSNRTYVGISVLANVTDVKISNTTIQNISQSLNNPYPTHIPSGIRIYEGTKQIVVDGVTIKNVYSKYKWVTGAPPIARGILITPNNDVNSPSEVVVENSTIDGVGPKDDGDGICVQLFKTKVNVQILNNTFLHTQKRAIKIQSPGALIRGNKMVNSYNRNNFYQYSPDPKWYDMWSAISVYANDVTVENNQITGIGNYGAAVDIAGGNNVLIKGNSIENGIHSNYKKGNLIVVSKDFNNNINFSNITITGNLVKNGNDGIVISAKVKNLSVYGNKAINCFKGYVK
ncbi:MAG: glycosyl hydrolase family 28-related protein [Bacillota bacterium]|nr:glycosyl hydrolase family 28-related protein [Bacillota bacterium]